MNNRLLLASLVSLVACGASSSGTNGDSSTSTNSSSGIEIGAIDASNSDSKTGDSTSNSETTYVPFDGVVNDDTACANSQFSASVKPPMLLFLLDRSGSMANTATNSKYYYYPTSLSGTGSGGLQNNNSLSDTNYAKTKYSQLATALKNLFDPTQDNIPQTWKFGATFFTSPGSLTSGDACGSTATYQNPEVALNTVATNYSLLNCWTGINAATNAACTGIAKRTEPNFAYQSGTSSIPAVYPSGNTPMYQALTGAISYMQSITTDAARVVVLVTDGEPNCDYTITDVVAAAKAGHDGTPQVLTYTIGVPGADASLGDVATAGGGDNFTISATSTTYIDDLVTAFTTIGKKSLSCSFDVPTPSNGQLVDPNAVSVQLTAGGTTTTVSKDTTNTSGWNYSSGGQKITLYGAACTTVKQDTTASIKILVACQTAVTTETSTCSASGGSCPCCLGYYCTSANVCAANPIVPN